MKVAAWFLSVLSLHQVKPSLWGSLARDGGAGPPELAGPMGRAGESLAHHLGYRWACPWGAGPAWPSHSAPLTEELCTEIAVGKPPPPFPELKICQAVCAGRYL